MGTAVNLFVVDPSFYDHTSPFISVLDNPGIGQLTQNGLSYFIDAYSIKDTRGPNDRSVDWAAAYNPTALIDQNYYSLFITQMEALPSSNVTALFQMIDRAIFNPSNTGAIETWFTTTAGVKDIYVPNSFSKATFTATGTVYPASNVGQPFTTSPFVTFSINIPTGSTTTQYDLTIFCDNNTWISYYPNSTVVAVSPPLSYSDLYNLALSTANANKLATASGTVDINYDSINAQIKAKAASGYLMFTVGVKDLVNEVTLPCPFLILYKGNVPEQIQIREAIKDALLNSGVGTEDGWKQRIPDVFVDVQFWLIPMYDNVTKLSDGHIYPGVINLKQVMTNMNKVLPIINSSVIQQDAELLSANYEKLLIGCVVDPNSNTTSGTPTSILETFPTYQAWPSTDPNFQYMDPIAQSFSLALSAVLMVATQNGTNPLYSQVTERNVTYIPFVINSVEYNVVTMTSYLTIIQETA